MLRGTEDAASLLDRARRADDELEQRLLLAAAVQRAGLGVGVQSVLTGGTAADFYASGTLGTSEAYPLKWRPSADIDVVVLATHASGDARVTMLRELERLGLRPRWVGGSARVVDVPEFPFTLEIVGDELSRDPRAERVVTVLLDGAVPVTIRSPEDVILAYGESGWHLRHGGDWTRALAVYSAMRDRLDVPRMVDEATRRSQRAVLDAVMRLEPAPWRRGAQGDAT